MRVISKVVSLHELSPMKATFSTLAIAFGVWLLSKQPAALSQVTSTPAPAPQYSRDLAHFPNFFQEGLKKTETELQRLIHTEDTSREPALKNNVNSQAERDRLPQIQPSNWPTPDRSQPE